MDEIRETEIIISCRRIENIIKNIEENEAKTNEAMEAIRRKSESNKPSIGPANDLLRFFYILEQQYQNDTNEVRTETRENLLKYFDQFRQSDDVIEEVDDDQQSEQSDEPQQSEPIVFHNPPPPTVVLQPPPVVPPPSQPPPAASPPSVKSQPSSSLSPVTDPNHIRPDTLVEYEKLLFEAQQYEDRYKTIDHSRKTQLARPIQGIMNKLRKDTFTTLTNELFQYLNGQERKISDQIIRISNEEERLLCLSMLATSILAQLLGGDLSPMQSEVFLPLVDSLSRSPQFKEFRCIFLDRLHKKCPYTIPLYPKRQPTMDDRQYLVAMGYIEKLDGSQRRLETDDEFLVRMNGLIRLFCKLLVNRIPPFDKDLSFGWTWCSDVLNLPARPNITLILLRVFLEEAGETMMKEYPKQFPKIIQTIRRNLPQLAKGTSDSEISRLQTALEKFP